MTYEEILNDYLYFVRPYPLIHDNKELMDWLCDNSFFISPASSKYHGVYPGGLYMHSRAVSLRLLDLTEKNGLQWQRSESPIIVGMFHDLCKCDQYIERERPAQLQLPDGTMSISPVVEKYYDYNTNTLLKGHGAKSVLILSHLMTLTEEEMLCIRYHMGAYEKEEWTEYDMAIRKYTNVLWTHHADMLASKIDNT